MERICLLTKLIIVGMKIPPVLLEGKIKLIECCHMVVLFVKLIYRFCNFSRVWCPISILQNPEKFNPIWSLELFIFKDYS
jgi:hypothetical protein